MPRFSLAKATEFRCFVVLLCCCLQFKPPSLVERMVPSTPTAHPRLSSLNQTEERCFLVPLFSSRHDSPRSIELRIVPRAPTAQASFPFIVSPYSGVTTNERTGIHFCPPSSVRRIVPSLPTARPRRSSLNLTP